MEDLFASEKDVFVAPFPKEGEEPLVRTQTTVDSALSLRIGKGLRKGLLFLTIAGILLLLGYIVTDVVIRTLAEEGQLYVRNGFFDLLSFLRWIGAIFLVIGLVGYFTSRASAKRTAVVLFDHMAFYRTYLLIATVRAGETVILEKVYYANLLRVKETKDLILLYNTSATAYVVDKLKLKPEELSVLRGLIPLK